MAEMFFMTKNRSGIECDSVGGVYFIIDLVSVHGAMK